MRCTGLLNLCAGPDTRSFPSLPSEQSDSVPSHLRIPPLEGELPQTSPADMEKVRYVFKNLCRDWSKDGEAERAACYGPLIEARELRRMCRPLCEFWDAQACAYQKLRANLPSSLFVQELGRTVAPGDNPDDLPSVLVRRCPYFRLCRRSPPRCSDHDHAQSCRLADDAPRN